MLNDVGTHLRKTLKTKTSYIGGVIVRVLLVVGSNPRLVKPKTIKLTSAAYKQSEQHLGVRARLVGPE